MNEFKIALRDRIILHIIALKRDGTNGMSFDNFFQVFARYIPAGGPRGTNATYLVKQDMREVIATLSRASRDFFLD